MHIEKLFRVLVVGGALAVQSPLFANQIMCEIPEVTPPPQEELSPLFCDAEDACVVDAEGKKVPKAGFFCCWGTECAE